MAATVEEPSYEVTATHPGFEVRRYEPLVQARVRVEGSYRSSVYAGFRVLADYIFGANQPRQEIAMTAPVGAQRAGERIAMTAPVGAQRAGERIAMTAPVGAIRDREAWVITFTMPREHTLDSLPAPRDTRVELHALPEQRVAVSSFSGWAWEGRTQRRIDELLRSVEAEGLVPVGEPVIAQYDPPWTVPFLRRNEILVQLESSGS